MSFIGSCKAVIVVMQCSSPVLMLFGNQKGRKNFRVMIFFVDKNWLGSRNRKQTIF